MSGATRPSSPGRSRRTERDGAGCPDRAPRPRRPVAATFASRGRGNDDVTEHVFDSQAARDRERSGGASRARGRGCGLGDVAGDAAALLLGEAAPNAVALAVLDGPGQARVTDRAGAPVRERQTGIFLGSRKELLGVNAIARRAVLPQVRWHRILRKTRRI